MVQTRNPAGEGGASDGSVHAAKLNTSDHTRATATHQVFCGCLTDSPDGQPWPPSDSNALGSSCDAGGYTLWRAISLLKSKPLPPTFAIFR